jgi:hypothetical protein
MNTIFISSHSSRYPFVRLIGLAVLILACEAMLIQASPTGEGRADTCRATVGVAVTKADKLGGESFTANISRSISAHSGINAIPISSAFNEAEARAQAARQQPDYLLLMDVSRGSNAATAAGGNFVCGLVFGRSCGIATKPAFKVRYVLEEFGTRRIIKSGSIDKSASDEGKAVSEVAAELQRQIGPSFDSTSDTVSSLAGLRRKHQCYSGFPKSPASLIMKYDVTTAGKKVSFDYFLKGNLWRVSIRPKAGDNPYIIGYNGNQIWSLNRSEGVSVFTPGNSNQANNRNAFLVGEFLSEADSENLKFEIVSSTLLGKELVNGKNCHVVESVSRADTYLKFYYDAQTGALIRKTILDENKKIESETDFDDYREVTQGTRFPFRITARSAAGESKVAFVEVNLNPEISNERFLKPA